MQRSLFLLLSVFLFMACAMPETKIYSLSMPSGRTLNSDVSGALVNLRVQSPRYLSQQYIVHRTSPYQVEISRYSRWELPPAEMMKEFFIDALYSRGISKEVKTLNIVPAGYYALDIKLRRFERVDRGDGSFGEVDFDINVLSPDGREIFRKAISKKAVMQGKDNADLAASLSTALSEALDEAMAGIGVIRRP